MNRFVMILAAAAALAGCAAAKPQEGAKAEREWRIVERTTKPGWRARCEGQRVVANAYLRDENEERFRHWSVMADAACHAADAGV
jgi:hypothetical protein